MSALPPKADMCGATRDVRFGPEADIPTNLMSPTRTYIGVLHRDGPPFSINLTHDAGTNAGPLGLVNVAMYVELGMHHGDVRSQKAHMHYWCLAGTRSEWPAGTVEALH